MEEKRWSLVFKPLRYLSLSELKLENLKDVISRKSGHHRKPDPTSEYQGWGDKKTSFCIILSGAVKKKRQDFLKHDFQ